MDTKKKTFKIGFIGFGTVAGAVWKNLDGGRLAARFGVDYELSKVCVRDLSKKRAVEIPPEKLTQNPYDIINDPEIDIVCELMGGTGAAFDYTIAALRNGKTVVSANKAVICARGEEIFAEAKKSKGSYFFEASVAGGVPIIKVLREGLVANRFPLIYGILNGTCNYILTRMERENAAYETILADAKRLGYVEADESLDLDGIDASHKISILGYIAHGVWIKPSIVCGIRRVTLEDMAWAKDFGYRVKLIAAVRTVGEEGALFASVYPALVPLSDAVANVNEVYNAVAITGDVVGRTIHIGRGAGGDATSSAVIADIFDAIKYISGEPKTLIPTPPEKARVAELDEVSGEFYIRLEVDDEAGVLASIAKTLSDCGISIETLMQRSCKTEGRAWLLLTTHTTTERAIQRACGELKNNPKVSSEPFVLRFGY